MAAPGISHSQRLPEILVLGPPSVFRIYDKEFSSRFRVLRSWESPLPLEQFLAAEAQTAEIAFTSGVFTLSAAVLQNLPCLRLVVSASAGVDRIALDECRRRGIAVTNAPSVSSVDVADLAVGLLLDVQWKITAGNRSLKNGVWSRQLDPRSSKLHGKQVGIVGLGSIGLKVAKRLEPFGCKISYYSRSKKPSVSYAFYPDIRELATTSNILVLCCALTEETRHLINRDVMLALGKDGVIVNVARGAVIEEKELLACLQNGEIAGAGLDVFENEPRVPKELWELENVVLSPHFAIFTEEAFRELFELVCGNIEAFLSNNPLLTPISIQGN